MKRYLCIYQCSSFKKIPMCNLHFMYTAYSKLIYEDFLHCTLLVL